MTFFDKSDRIDPVVDLWAVLLDCFGSQAIRAANFRVEVHALAPGAQLRCGVQPPEPKPLAPTPFPFEIIHKAPVEIPLHRHVMVDHVPHRVKMLQQILASEIVLAIFSAILCDVNRFSELGPPFDAGLETLRVVAQKTGFRKFRVFGERPPGEHLCPFAEIKLDQLTRVIIQSDEILGVLCLGNSLFQERSIEFARYQCLGESSLNTLLKRFALVRVKGLPFAGRKPRQ